MPAPFVFETVRRIDCRPGAIRHLAEELHTLSCRRLLIVTDRGIVQSGLLEPLLNLLRPALETVLVYSGVQPDPPEQVVLEAVEMGRANAVDSVVGLGGGSSLDTAKLAALLIKSPQKPDDIFGVGLVRGSRLPLILVPTTAGTGSEVTPIAIVTTLSQEKKGVVAPQLLADVALLDPELTLSVPPAVTAATGVDAMVHAIEAFTSRRLKNPISDSLALEAIRLLHGNIRRVMTHGDDVSARMGMLQGSLLAGMAFANAPVAAVHALAYPLGARFHLPHGLCNALMLPHILAFNAEEDPTLYAPLAKVIFPADALKDERELSSAFIDELRVLRSELGMPTQLRDAGIAETDLEVMATDAVKIERLLKNNPRPVGFDDALRLYREAW